MVRVKMFPRAEILAESNAAHKSVNYVKRNDNAPSNLKFIDNTPCITLNIKDLHIHLDESTKNQCFCDDSEPGEDVDFGSNIARLHTDDADFDDCGLDCDYRCEHCVIGTGGGVDSDDAVPSMDELISIIQKKTGLHRTIVMLVIDEVLENLDRRIRAAEKKGDCLK